MTSAADDRFTTYFTEKIWEMIPAFYREDDAEGDNPGALRALVVLLAEKAAVVRRSNDRLWDDVFIDLCDSWAVPYLADLVATRLVSSLNRRAWRIDVAKTIYYRRRKGTVRILEELISDITAWDGVVVEEFRRLARAWHGLDPKPAALAGRFTGTLPGGCADLRRPRGSELANGPFDEYFHLPDVRQQRGTDGVYNIPKIAFHLYRLAALPLTGVTPMPGPNSRTFTFDPSGRDVPSFSRRERDAAFDWDQWRSAREWELPAPIRCRVLGHAEYQVTEAAVLDLIASAGLSTAGAADLRRLRDHAFASETRLRDALAALPSQVELLGVAMFAAILRLTLIADCGKSALWPQSLFVESPPGTMVAREAIVAGDLSQWTASAPGKALVIDAERGRLLFVGAGPGVRPQVGYCYGFSGPIGAGSYDRAAYLLPPTLPPLVSGAGLAAASMDPGTASVVGVTELADSSTFGPAANPTGVRNMQIQGRNQQRPYLRLGADWILDATPNTDAVLTIDGLWIGTAGNFALVLAGGYKTVTLRHVTLDPGGADAQGNPIAPLPIVITGSVEKLVVESSIIAPVRLNGGAVDELVVSDSIVQSIAPFVAAIALPGARLDIRRTTVFGAVKGDRLYASEALFTGLVDIDDTQDGCFRFSAARTGSRVPHPYESTFIDDVAHFFTSRRFGDPGYAQLSASAPAGLARGAENGSEIGAFSSLLNPIRLDGLRAKVDEYMPFGLIPAFIFNT